MSQYLGLTFHPLSTTVGMLISKEFYVSEQLGISSYEIPYAKKLERKLWYLRMPESGFGPNPRD